MSVNLQRTPIYRALNRSNLFWGGDRELVMTAMLAVFTCLVTLDVVAVVFGLLLGAASIYLLRKMARSDPDMRYIYLRHRKYRNFYSSRSTPFRIDQ